MSVESITWALKVPVPASSAKFVLVVLANQANDETGLSFPSVSYLADATGQDRKTVIGNLAKLVQWGLIEDTGQRVGATRQIVVYRLLKGDDLFAEQSQKRNAPKSGTVPKAEANSTVFPSKESRFSAKGSQKRDTEPSEPSRNRKSNHSAPVALDLSTWPSQPSPQVLADWRAHRKAKRAPISETVLASFGTELHRAGALGWSVDECLTECMNRNWQGFKAEWLRDSPPSKFPDNGASHASCPPAGKPSLADSSAAATAARRDGGRPESATGHVIDGTAARVAR